MASFGQLLIVERRWSLPNVVAPLSRSSHQRRHRSATAATCRRSRCSLWNEAVRRREQERQLLKDSRTSDVPGRILDLLMI